MRVNDLELGTECRGVEKESLSRILGLLSRYRGGEMMLRGCWRLCSLLWQVGRRGAGRRNRACLEN